MKITKFNIDVDFNITMSLNELEARALKAITVYGTKGFLSVFYKHLGKSSLEPYEDGLKSLFEGIETQLTQKLNKADEIRKKLKN